MYTKIALEHRSFLNMFMPEAPIHKQFDLAKAVEIIKHYEMRNASVGLAEDWTYTKAVFLVDGKPACKNLAPFLSSRWATPAIHDLDNPNYTFECYLEVPEEEAAGHTLWWTDEALAKLGFTREDMVTVSDESGDLLADLFEDMMEDEEW